MKTICDDCDIDTMRFHGCKCNKTRGDYYLNKTEIDTKNTDYDFKECLKEQLIHSIGGESCSKR